MLDVIVIGAGPAGVLAALRAADQGARTALITRDEFGGMAANDGLVPVRTLSRRRCWSLAAARLERGSPRSSTPSVHESNSSRQALAFCLPRTKKYRPRSRPLFANQE